MREGFCSILKRSTSIRPKKLFLDDGQPGRAAKRPFAHVLPATAMRVGEGDFIIISANPIPGNEKMVTKVITAFCAWGRSDL